MRDLREISTMPRHQRGYKMRITNGLECVVTGRVISTITFCHWSSVVNDLIDEESKNNSNQKVPFERWLVSSYLHWPNFLNQVPNSYSRFIKWVQWRSNSCTKIIVILIIICKSEYTWFFFFFGKKAIWWMISWTVLLDMFCILHGFQVSLSDYLPIEPWDSTA